MVAYLGLVLLVVGTVVVTLVLLVAVVVDVGSEVVAIVAILVNVSWSTVTSGACASPLSCPASSGGVGSRCGVCPWASRIASDRLPEGIKQFREACLPARSGLCPQALGRFPFGLLLLRAPFYLPEAEPGQDEDE
jgi:hypothetical protein